MLSKVFIILSLLLCSSVIQLTVAARDLAQDTKDVWKAYRALVPGKPVCPGGRGKPYGRCTPPRPVHQRPCNKVYGCHSPPPTP